MELSVGLRRVLKAACALESTKDSRALLNRECAARGIAIEELTQSAEACMVIWRAIARDANTRLIERCDALGFPRPAS